VSPTFHIRDPWKRPIFFSYNIREENEDVSQLAMNRSISVTVGVVWAGIVSRYWWPTEARRELSRALGE
jgi:hypothetical protein